MNPRFHKTVIAKVKQSIQKISQSRLRRPKAVDGLVKMNVPPLAGRRDATYLRVEKIFAGKVSDGSLAEREKLYGLALQLLDRAIKDSKIIVGAMSGEELEDQEREISDLLRLLRNSVQTVWDALNFNLCQQRQRGTKTEADASILSQIDNINLAKNEENIASHIDELLEMTRKQFADYRNRTVKSFDRSGVERYHAAFKSYSEIRDDVESTSLSAPGESGKQR